MAFGRGQLPVSKRPKERAWVEIVANKNGLHAQYVGQKGVLVKDAKGLQPFKVKFADGQTSWWYEEDVAECQPPSDEPPSVSGADSPQGIEIPMRILFSNRQVARIIGKNGILIKELREESGAVIDILDKQLPAAFAGGDERVLHILGMVDQTGIAVSNILRLAITEDHPFYVELMIPELACSYLSDGSGARVGALIDETKCDLHIVGEPIGGLVHFRRLQISGPSLRSLSLVCMRVHRLLADLVVAGGLEDRHFDVKNSGVSGAIHAYLEQRRAREVAEQIPQEESGLASPPYQPQAPGERRHDFEMLAAGSVQHRERGTQEFRSSILPVPALAPSCSERPVPPQTQSTSPERIANPMTGADTSARATAPSPAMLPVVTKTPQTAQTSVETASSVRTPSPAAASSPTTSPIRTIATPSAKTSVETTAAVQVEVGIVSNSSFPETSFQYPQNRAEDSYLFILLPSLKASHFCADTLSGIERRSGAQLSYSRGSSGEFILRLGGTPIANAVACYLVQEALWMSGLLCTH